MTPTHKSPSSEPAPIEPQNYSKLQDALEILQERDEYLGRVARGADFYLPAQTQEGGEEGHSAEMDEIVVLDRDGVKVGRRVL